MVTLIPLPQNNSDLSALRNEIQQLGFRARALPETCKQLVSHCERVIDMAQPTSCSMGDDKRLCCALKQVVKLLANMSSSFYVWRFSKSLGDRITTAWKEISEISEATKVHPVLDEHLLKRELDELATSLRAAAKPQAKAYKIFSKGVSCISNAALARWFADHKLVIDEESAQQVRYGHLFWAWLGQEMVLVKRVGEILGTSKDDTIKRAKALSHWMRACEGLMPVQCILLPDLIIYGRNIAIPLDVHLLRNDMAPEDKWRLAFKIASAVSYLHECMIIHRDLRAANVFMVKSSTGTFEPKLAGFEICRSDITESIGPENIYDAWQAPESRQGYGTSFKTDVFSFGVLMYEIAVDGPPEWIDRSAALGSVHDIVEHNVVSWILRSNLVAPSPQYVVLMRQCLAVDDTKRPTMAEVFMELSKGY